jgi:pyruvate,water dikinase
MELTLAIDQLTRSDVPIAGGKAANLGELTCARMPVPPGFAVTVTAYDEFLEAAGLRSRFDSLRPEPATGGNGALAREMRSLIANAEMPGPIASAIAAAYGAMASGPVAVRSSATAEDLAEASFAGQQDTFLNVEGEAAVIRAVQDCWASLFEERAVHYRANAGFAHCEAKMAVVVQRMVQANRSGVMFTLNPVTGDRSQLLIEAVYGLGEAVVSGVVTPDLYVVDKSSGAILDRQVAAQDRELVRCRNGSPGPEPNEWVPVDPERQARQKMADAEIGRLAEIGACLERHFGCPQDIEWAAQSEAFYILQARAVTRL